MVLDTKLKNISLWKRTLTVLLAALFFGTSVFFAADAFLAVKYYNGDARLLWSNSQMLAKHSSSYVLKSRLYEDVSMLERASYYSNSKGIREAVSEQKDAFISEVLREFEQEKSFNPNYNQSYYTDEYGNEYGEDEVYYDEASGSYVHRDGNTLYIVEEETTAYYNNDEGFSFTYYFKYNSEPAIIVSESFLDEPIFYYDSTEQARAKLEAAAEKLLALEDYTPYLGAGSETFYSVKSLSPELYYYIENASNGAVLTNIEVDGTDAFDYFAYGAQKDYYILIDGVGNVSSSDNLNDVVAGYTGWDDSSIKAVIYIEPAAGETYSSILANQEYISQIDFKTDVIIALVCLIGALICGFTQLVICGTRLENGRVKRAFVDYIPIDIHLALSVLAVGFACAGLLALLEYTYGGYMQIGEGYNTLRVLISAAATLIPLLLLEFTTSVIRICKSGVNFLRQLALVWIAYYGIWKPLCWLHGRNKILFRKARACFGYKPQNFKERLVAWIIAYTALNLIVLFFAFVAAVADELFITALLTAILVAVNGVCAYFVFDYIKKLDLIITASRERTALKVDYDKLPNSLKALCDSLKYTNIELQEAVEKAVRDERLRTELITNVSHDLKTPLTSIINYVDLLKGCDIESVDAQEYIGVLDEKSSRLKRLIDDLIEASKITSGVITINPVELNLNELAAQAVVEQQQAFADNKLELVFSGEGKSVYAFADGNKTYRVLENLLSNARKYSAKGTRVYAEVYEKNGKGVFEIKNTSAEPLNITAEELKERFVRGDKARANEGNGLGLSIADMLCNVQGGKLTLSIDGDLFKAAVELPNSQ